MHGKPCADWCVCARANTHTHTHSRARTHTHMHTHTHACIHTHTHSCAYGDACYRRAIYTRRALDASKALSDTLLGVRTFAVDQMSSNVNWVSHDARTALQCTAHRRRQGPLETLYKPTPVALIF